MSVLEALERLKLVAWTMDDGESFEVEVDPGLDDAAITKLERELGAPLPSDYRLLLANVGELFCPGPDIDFRGFGGGLDLPDIFPRNIAFAHDGFGNYWIVDLLSSREPEAVLFFVCHDPPIVLYQGTGLAGFLEDMILTATDREHSVTENVAEDLSYRVWKTNPGLMSQPDALQSADTELSSFATSLDPNFHICDLRAARPGMGFAWERYGSQTRVRRFGEQRIFAIAEPELKKSMFSWIHKR